MKWLRGLVLALLLPCSAMAQAVQQSGAIIPFHLGAWANNGAMMDAGSPSLPAISAEGLFGGGTCPFAISSQPSKGTPPAQYSQLSLCQTNSVTTFKIRSYGGLASPVVQFDINGVIYTFPQNNPTSEIIVITSGSSNTVPGMANQTILWKSPAALQKTQNLPACTSSTVGIELGISDDYGNAGTYAINLVPAGADTVFNHLLYFLNYDNQAVAIVCDGLGNWAASK